MAWHQKGLTKEQQAYAELLVAKGMLEIVNLQKENMDTEDMFKIVNGALEKIVSYVDFLEEHDGLDDSNRF